MKGNPIIDAHQHVFWAGQDDAGLVADLDKRGIDKAVVLTWCLMNAVDEAGYARSLNPAHAVAGQVHPGLPFSDVMQAVRRYPDRFVPGYAPDPTDPRGIRRLRWLLKVLLRRLRFRCVGVREENQKGHERHEDAQKENHEEHEGHEGANDRTWSRRLETRDQVRMDRR